MNKIISAMLATLLMLAASATAAPAAKKTGNNVEYTVLRNYFHNNDAPLPSSPLITTREEFDRQFGAAAFMGKDGQPTKIDFRKQAVLAIVLPVTTLATDIDSVSVRQDGNNGLILAYTVREGMDLGYSIQPVRLMAIARKYKAYGVKTVSKVVKDVKESKAAYEFVSYNDDRHNLYLNYDYPVGGGSKVVKAVRNWMAGQLGDMANGFSTEDMDNRRKIARHDDMDANTFRKTYANIITDSISAMEKANAKWGTPNPCSLYANISRVYEDGKIVSYESNGYNYTGGAHGISFCYGATFDKATGRLLKLVDDSLGLRKLVTERLHKNCDMQGLQFTTEPVPMPKATPYVIGEKKIKFIYQPYEIGAYAIGKPQCEFYPYEIEKYLTAEGKALEF